VLALPAKGKGYTGVTGSTSGGPFRLSRYPESRKAIKRALERKRFLGKP
jgi:hypothetical protein